MNNKPTKTPSNQSNIVLDRYVKLLLDKKYWIILIAIIVSALWVVAFPRILQSRQIYTATSIIRFDDSGMSRGATGVEESYSQTDPTVKMGILQTRSFLTKVVDSLKLNVNIYKPKNNRLGTIDSIEILAYEKFGRYNLIRKNNQWQLFYTNKKDGYENSPIQQYSLDIAAHKLTTSSFSIKFKPQVLKSSEEIIIGFIPTRLIIESFKGERMDLRLEGGRRQPMLEINLKSKDQRFVPVLANVITGLFLDQLLEFKREKTKAVLSSLQDQLTISLNEVELIEQDIKIFRERNPYVSRNQNVAQFNTQILADQNNLTANRQRIQQLEQLLSEKDKVALQNRNMIYFEIISYLNQQQVPGSVVLDEQYGNALLELQELKDQNYSMSHPRMVEINNSLKKQQLKINERANNYLAELRAQVNRLRENLRRTDTKIRRLPRKEIEYARLIREYEARSSIYSNVLRRFNEAKVVYASATPDAFLLEKAVVPIVEMKGMGFLSMLLMGLLFGMMLASGLFIGIDIIWHRARAVDDLESTLEIPVLATIPIIKTNNEVPETIDMERKLDPKLITIDYSPNYDAEVFRNLRTKLKLKYSTDERSTFVLTSLSPGDGKSLITSNLAVTFAQLKKPTLLIDADMRRGVQHNIFLADKKPGLSDLLAHTKEVNAEVITPMIQKTIVPNLFMISSGKPVPNPTEILVGDKIEKLIEVLQQRFNYILFDTPPIEMIADAFILNKIIRKMMITVRYGQTDLNRMKKKLQEFPEIKEDTIGLVFNGTKDKAKQNYYSYSYYKY